MFQKKKENKPIQNIPEPKMIPEIGNPLKNEEVEEINEEPELTEKQVKEALQMLLNNQVNLSKDIVNIKHFLRLDFE